MEKVKIKAVYRKEYNGKVFYNVIAEDGRTGTCSDSKIENTQGQTLTLDLKPSKVYNGTQQYYFNFPKGGTAVADTPKESNTQDSAGLARLENKIDRILTILETNNPPF